MKLPAVMFPHPIPDVIGLDKKNQYGRPLYRLQVPFEVWIEDTMYQVPAGFVFDFASAPRVAWSLTPPYDNRYAAAVLLHDWAYGGELWPRRLNDELMLAGLRVRGVKRWKRVLMWTAVRVGGGYHYRHHHPKERVLSTRRLSGFPVVDRSPLWENLGESALYVKREMRNR